MKKTKSSKPDKKKKNEISRMIIIAVVIALLVLLVGAVLSYIIKNEKSEKINDDCNCIEWKGEKYCPTGYVLDGGACLANESVTNPQTSCSKYNCSGEIITK